MSISRRRALFPTDENSADSGLGHISPLCFDTDSDDENSVILIKENINSFISEKMNHDYDIIGTIDIPSTPNCSNKKYCASDTMSPLYLSPNSNVGDVSFIESPSDQLKTPHDISDNTILPKLIRKSLFDISTDNINNNCIDNGDTLNLSHSKNSKVRTALFPDLKISLLPKSFYSKSSMNTQNSNSSNSSSSSSCNRNNKKSPSISLKKESYICGRKKRGGQINRGVRHNIKKPKFNNKINKEILMKAALNIIENSPLNNYLDNTNNESEQIEEKNEQLLQENKKRPHSPSPKIDSNRKFFKTDSDSSSRLNKSLCDMTSDLVITSPKKPEKKLFSIFYPSHVDKTKKDISSPRKSNTNTNNNAGKKFHKLSEDQMFLDAGQKRFGATQCCECKFIYHMGDPNDEILHLNYHSAGNIFKYNGWKNERVVADKLSDGKIIHILPGDSKLWWKKVKEILQVVNRDLGFFDIQFIMDNIQVFLYIKNKTVIGVLVAEPKQKAHKLLTVPSDHVDLCSEETYDIKCGVSRIWINRNYRKQGIGTNLMNCLKQHFLRGNYILKNNDIALSTPTNDGKQFGVHYFNTSNFFMYYE